MTSSPKLPEFVIMCDDVRDELSGKTTLVGVYANTINFPRIPAVWPLLCFWLSGSHEFVEKGLQLRLESPSKRRLSSMNLPPPPAEIAFEPDASVNFGWKVSPIRFDEIGEYQVKLLSDGDESVIYKFKVAEKPEMIPGTPENKA